MSAPIKHSMIFKVVTMTPIWAQELLDHNHPNNRSPKKGKIEQYARDMEQGFWRLTPEPVCTDLDGWLINGQNRLSAVIRADVEVPMTLVTGCPTQSLRGMDQGMTRNFADNVKISGEKLACSSANNLAAVVRCMHAGMKYGSGSTRLTNAEAMVLAKNYNDALEFAFSCMKENAKGITQAPVRAAIARSYYRRNFRNRTRAFCEVLLSGLPEDPKKDSGAIRLRNWLIDTFLGGLRKSRTVTRPRPVLVYAKTERALQAFHEEEYIQSLVETREELFPMPGESDEDESEILKLETA